MEDNSYVYIMDASIQIPFPPPTWKYLFPRISFPKYIIDTIFSSPIKFEKPKKKTINLNGYNIDTTLKF